MVEHCKKPVSYEAVIRPNRSTSWNETMVFLTGISVVSLVIAFAFLMMGYWMVLPFTGLELLLLAVAFYKVARDGQRCQVISVDEKTVRIEKGWSRHGGCGKSGPEVKYEFPSAWAKLEFAAPRRSWYPARLLVGSGGKKVEIGEFLPEQERLDLAEQLGLWLARTA
ncbi:MAG: DUF2244 domain-containing protein [Chromatiales bacterium]